MLQLSEVECGAASLAMILAREGRWVPIAEMREACGISRDGATALDLVRAGRDYGIEGKGHLRGLAELNGMAMPAIIWMRESHFVVLEGAHGGTFTVNDPDKGRVRMSAEQFADQYSDAALTFERTPDFRRDGRPFSTLRALATRMAKSRGGMVFAALAGLLTMVTGVAVGPLSQAFVDSALDGDLTSTAVNLVIAFVAIAAIQFASIWLEYLVLARLETKLALVGATRFLERLLTLPLSFFMQRSAGDLAQRLTYNTAVAQAIAGRLAATAIALVGVVAYATLLLSYQLLLGLIVILLACINLLVLRAVVRARTTAQSRVTFDQDELRGVLLSQIDSIETIKASGTERQSLRALTGRQASYLSANASMAGTDAILVASPVVTSLLTAASVLTIGGMLVVSGEFTLGALLAVQVFAFALNEPVNTLVDAGGEIQLLRAQLRALDDVTGLSPDLRFRTTARTTDSDTTEPPVLRLRGVTFGYSTRHDPTVSAIDLSVGAGQRVALVGPSGSGKSTVGDLAAGLLHPWEGEITLGGVPVQALEPGRLQKVDQSVVLFEGTVRDNVALWDATTTEDAIRLALSDAGVLDEILRRGGGIDARVDERGRNFSGGQRQRLEIARALACDPRALILDEATSALDPPTEALVDEALRRRGTTCLIIAHRLSTIRDADEIVVMGRNGRIAERGTHDQLMATGGAYARLVADRVGARDG
ncbi:ATP-binding cassette domain-containing protein [Microbacterium sediminicola]|uniref:ATP-binding cassette domain-containing protein n=1 Tax=Microbacterium sediminicola TaxID=415210 RepID=UPI0031D7AEE7